MGALVRWLFWSPKRIWQTVLVGVVAALLLSGWGLASCLSRLPPPPAAGASSTSTTAASTLPGESTTGNGGGAGATGAAASSLVTQVAHEFVSVWLSPGAEAEWRPRLAQWATPRLVDLTVPTDPAVIPDVLVKLTSATSVTSAVAQVTVTLTDGSRLRVTLITAPGAANGTGWLADDLRPLSG